MVEAMTDRYPWDLENPADILMQVNAVCRFKLGRTIVAAVRLSDQPVTGGGRSLRSDGSRKST